MTRPTTQVLMATYNASEYLPPLLDSLLAQTVQDWELLVRDDGSTDATCQVLESYQDRFPHGIRLDTAASHSGACESFSRVMDIADADYVAFADADDVWFADKIEMTRAALQRQEQLHGQDTPILVHTDLRVVDAELKELSASLWDYQGRDIPGGHPLRRILVQNVVTGCTVMINRALLTQARPIPPDAIMHDWWLALVAASFGIIHAVRRPSLLYRQHSANDSGAKPWTPLRTLVDVTMSGSLWSGATPKGFRVGVTVSQRQARALDRFCGSSLSPAQRAVVRAYGSLAARGWLARRATLLRYGLLKPGILRNAGLMLYI